MCKIMEDLMIEAERRGVENGVKKGEENIASLMNKLFIASRYEDAKRAAADKAYRKKLMTEFGLA